MFNASKREFLFRCEDCKMILSIDFSTQEDFDKIQDDDLELECTCGGFCQILRD